MGRLAEEFRELRKFIEKKALERGSRPLAMSLENAGLTLGLSSKSISRMVKRGELFSIRGEGRIRLIATDELERWIFEHQDKPLHRKGGAKMPPPVRDPKAEAQRAREMLKRS